MAHETPRWLRSWHLAPPSPAACMVPIVLLSSSLPSKSTAIDRSSPKHTAAWDHVGPWRSLPRHLEAAVHSADSISRARKAQPASLWPPFQPTRIGGERIGCSHLSSNLASANLPLRTPRSFFGCRFPHAPSNGVHGRRGPRGQAAIPADQDEILLRARVRILL